MNKQESVELTIEEQEEARQEDELVVEIPVEIRAGARSPDCGPGVALA